MVNFTSLEDTPDSRHVGPTLRNSSIRATTWPVANVYFIIIREIEMLSVCVFFFFFFFFWGGGGSGRTKEYEKKKTFLLGKGALDGPFGDARLIKEFLFTVR